MKIALVKKTIVKWILAMLLLLAAFVIIGLYSALEITYYEIENKKLPVGFDGYRIAHISDFHSHEFGRRGQKLIDAVWSTEPDAIVLTGDILDRWNDSLQPVEDLLAGICGSVPVFAVAGNHEFEAPELFSGLLELYKQYGVVYLEESAREVRRGDDRINFYGTRFMHNDYGHTWSDRRLRPDDELDFNILLHHFSNEFDSVARSGFDLVLSGHTHGGIVRLPFLGGIIGNDGTLLPKYYEGVYHLNDSVMVSSRGLGDAKIPRFYNRRELVCVVLRRGSAG